MSSPGEKKPTLNGSANLVNGGGTGDASVIKKEIMQDPLPPTDDPELDALLDDALKDFDNPNLLKPKKKPSPHPNKNAADLMMDSVWAEEFIKQATTQFEQKMREYLKSSLEGGSKREQKLLEENMSKIVDAASTAALNTTTDPEALSSQLNEAIRNAASKATERKPSTSGQSGGAMPNFDMLGGLPDDNEFAKMMGGLGMGMGMDDDGFDDSTMNEILPFMNNMMQKLLSKELLQPVLTDIVTKYPDWLSTNREKIPSKDYDKYSQQYEYMRQICEEYASERESDASEVKKKRFERISDLMLKVQYAGPPPQELIGEDGTNPLPTFDPASGEQCSIM